MFAGLTFTGLTFTGLALAGCEATLGPLDAGQEPGGDPGASGKDLYADNCQVCHGVDAAGGGIWPGSIQGYEPILGMVSEGRGDMSPLSVTRDEIAKIQGYLLSFGPRDWSGLTGPEVYQEGCAACHGEEAQGTDRAFPLRFRASGYFTYVLRTGRESSLFESDMKAFGVEQISDAQVEEMIAWIDSFPNATTPQGLYLQFCGNCHGEDGRSGRAGKNLVEESISRVVRSGKEDSVSHRNYMPGWSSADLSDDEVAQIADYLQSL